ncbi:MAG: hypothetical protein U0264_15675 [Candidatus Kapaibacterium sp.]
MTLLKEQGQRLKLWIDKTYPNKNAAALALGMNGDTGLYRYFSGKTQIGTNMGKRIRAIAGEEVYVWIMTGHEGKPQELEQTPQLSPPSIDQAAITEQNKDLLLLEVMKRLLVVEQELKELKEVKEGGDALLKHPRQTAKNVLKTEQDVQQG